VQAVQVPDDFDSMETSRILTSSASMVGETGFDLLLLESAIFSLISELHGMTARASNNIPPSLIKIWQQEEQDLAALSSTMAEGRAIVSRDTYENGGWKMEEIHVRKPEKGELLVDMVASGICHTDALIGGIPDGKHIDG
jgi:hypothetical protein